MITSTDTLLIDCRFHTAHHVLSMPYEVDKSVSNTQIPQTLVCMCQWIYNRTMTWFHFMTPETDDIINSKAWYDNECFLDGVSYVYCPLSRMLKACDLKQRCPKFVNGVKLMTGEDVKLSRTVIYGGKVVVFLQKEFDEKNEIWCAEIKVERGEEGELCGRVEWCGCVLEGEWLTLKNYLVVKV
ncbi:hypothetical protein Bca101_074264 [Brassica carinata]